ncbi:MAG: PaaI family thioesterase [Pikeienuella sp.]|uniref:PaaI family thioesterase n=1 Tax=Pikeienuella sp. TaxID=2831957 RepID=UPI00391A614A
MTAHETAAEDVAAILSTQGDIASLLGGMPFFNALQVEIVSVEPGSVTLEAPLTPAFEAPPGAFAASSVGALGDMAAMTSVSSALPRGSAMSTMDFTVKMLGLSRGSRLRAVGRVLQTGKTTCVGAADVFVLDRGAATLCGTVLATGRRLDLAMLTAGSRR